MKYSITTGGNRRSDRKPDKPKEFIDIDAIPSPFEAPIDPTPMVE
jgi:hypothetical protein